MGIKEEAATLPVLGVDVSKERLDAALLKEGGEFAGRAFGNSPAGRRALLEWARGRGAARPVLCVEASGGYELDLCAEAYRRGHRVVQVCALRTSNFRKSLHLRNKTDTDDARLLCRFALHMRLRAWRPTAPKVRELKELVLVRGHAVKEAGKHRDLTGKMRTAAGRRNARRTANAFAREAGKVTAEIGRLLGNAPEFAETSRLLASIPGVGLVTIAAVGAVGDLGRFDDVRQFAAVAGIHPGRRQSGAALDRARVCKTGDPALRSAIFMAALSASVHNPAVRVFAQQMRARRPDLCSKQIICACAHKLLRIIFGVVKSRRPFEHSPGGQHSPATRTRPQRTPDRAPDAAPLPDPQHTGSIARQTLGQLQAQLDRNTGRQHPVAPIGGNAFNGC